MLHVHGALEYWMSGLNLRMPGVKNWEIPPGRGYAMILQVWKVRLKLLIRIL